MAGDDGYDTLPRASPVPILSSGSLAGPLGSVSLSLKCSPSPWLGLACLGSCLSPVSSAQVSGAAQPKRGLGAAG